MNMQSYTLSETSIAPENRPFPKESSHPSTIVEGYVRFRECLDDIVQVLNKENTFNKNSFYAGTFAIDSCTIWANRKNWIVRELWRGVPILNYHLQGKSWGHWKWQQIISNVGLQQMSWRSSGSIWIWQVLVFVFAVSAVPANILVLLVPSIYVYTYCNYTWMCINVWDLKHQEYGLKMFVSQKTHVLPLQDSSFKSINEFQLLCASEVFKRHLEGQKVIVQPRKR